MPKHYFILEKRPIICDFCSSQDVHWSYDCPDFSLTLPSGEPWGSTEGWAACDACHDFIEANDWDGLRERAVASYFDIHPDTLLIGATAAVRRRLDSDLRLMHGRFAELKTGVEHI